MKHLMLAAVASIALALPAMAQSNSTNAMQPNDQAQTGSQMQSRIDPSQLSTRQIRALQMSLNKKGFDTSHVDGKWGPETQAAVKNFQQKQNIRGNGQLDRQTMAALGVNAGSASQSSATTGAGSHEQHMNSPRQNPGRMDNDANGTMTHGTTGQASPSSPSMNKSSGGNADSAYGQGGTSKPSVNDGH